MKGLLRLLGWLLFSFMLTGAWQGWTNANVGEANSPVTGTFMVGDTTYVACEHADTAYSTWINTVQLQILLANPGATIIVEPEPPLFYSFSGPCADTLSFLFRIIASGGAETRQTFVFIARDIEPPVIHSPLPDSISLGCKDPIPAAELVTVSDNCADPPSILFNEKIEGSGNCPSYKKIIRTWVARDACGNQSSYRQVILISDEDSPVFQDFPPDLTLDCTQPTTPAATGRPTAKDICDANPVITFSDQIVPSPAGCSSDYTIRRNWQAEDNCGNGIFRTQLIRVVDNKPPTFTPPANVTISCQQGDDPNFTGFPTNLQDNCSQVGRNNVRYRDVLIASSCVNTYSVQRTWYVFDACGNTDSVKQRIDVVDDQAPEFIQKPQDLILQCGGETGLEDVFQEWINRRGGAVASDNCSTPESRLQWTILNSGTLTPVSFPEVVCQRPDKVILERMVDFMVSDECGNTNTLTAVFRVLDILPPLIRNCPTDTVIASEPGKCEGVFVLLPPAVEEGCYLSSSQFRQSLSQPVSAAGGGNPSETAVNPIRFSFTLPAPIPVNAATNGGIRISLDSVDGKRAGEFFNIFAEDGQLLGRTALTDTACGKSDTLIVLTVAQLNKWAADGKIEFLLQPNLPQGQSGEAAINPVCPGGKVKAELRFIRRDFAGLKYQYAVNGGPKVNRPTGSLDTLNLIAGNYRITYFITDCGGNLDSCSFKLTVEDRQAPIVNCPSDTTVQLAAGSCTARLTLPLPPAISDNCGFPERKFSYYSSGATSIPLTVLPVSGAPVYDFLPGVSNFFYILSDIKGNTDTCFFRITVQDKEKPVAKCQPTTLFVNPSGLEATLVNAREIDGGSSDNCGIDSMFISPNAFNCSQAGSVQNVMLTVVDRAGNTAVCSTIVRIESLAPEPSANSGLCGSDTLFLNANPPPAVGGVVYTYRWTGPNGFTSTRQNPVIPNVGSRNAGSYAVEITGITGCKATGVVEVSIEDLPLTPSLVSTDNYCEDQDIVLSSSIAPTGTNIVYRWYRGTAPSGVLIGSTIVPSLTIRGPHQESVADYYLTIESNGCTSRPSAPKTIRVTKKPVAIPSVSAITLCEGESLALGTEVAGPGITYEWTGPNAYRSTSQFPTAISNATAANSGIYRLVVSRFGCASDPAFVAVNILTRPGRPEISVSGPVCEGETITLRTNAVASIYTWIRPDLQEFSTTINTLALNNATNDMEGPWKLLVSVQGCKSELSQSVNVVVNDLPRPQAAVAPLVVCEGAQLVLSSSPVLSGATYLWKGPAGFSAVGSSATVDNVQIPNSGNYSVTVTSLQGCTGTSSVDVNVKKGVRIIAVSNDGPTCLNGPTDIRMTAALFPADDGTYQYRWTGPNGFLSTNREAIIPKATQVNNGNYQLRVTTAEGCPSAPALTVVDVTDPPRAPSSPRISESTPAPFCEGRSITLCVEGYQGNAVTYNWITPNNGIVVTESPCLTIPEAVIDDSGAYSVFVTVDGCSSRRSGEITISVTSKLIISATSNSPVCAGLPLELRATPLSGAVYRWSGPNFTSGLNNPVIPSADSALHKGEYTVVAEVNGCVSEPATTVVEVLPTPGRPEIVPVDPLCISAPGAVLRLALRAASTTPNAGYTWFGPKGPLGNTAAPAFNITNFQSFGNGIQEFTVVARLGNCLSAVSAPIRTELNIIPEDKAFAGRDFIACESDVIFLRGEEPSIGNGRWTIISGPDPSKVAIITPNKAVSAVEGLKGVNDYVFRWTLSNGACLDYSFDEVNVKVNFKDTVDAGENILACISRDIRLNAKPSPTQTGVWSQSVVQSLLGVRIEEPSNPQTLVTGLQPGNLYVFTWSVTGGCGETKDEVYVLISDPTPFAGPDRTICSSDPIFKLEAEEPTEGSRGRWKALNSGVVFNNPEDPQALASALQSGPNVLIWEIDQGICGVDSRDTVVITYKKNPKANDDAVVVPFGRDSEIKILDNDEYADRNSLRITRPPSNGTVQIRGDSFLIYRPNANFLGKDRLEYELCSQGCSCSTAEVIIEVGGEASCAVPSVITPNNDGVNDEFIVPCLIQDTRYPNSQVLIFNRWGDEVYRSPKPYRNNWAGTYLGEDLPAGTYFYIVDLGDGTKPLSGFVVIQR